LQDGEWRGELCGNKQTDAVKLAPRRECGFGRGSCLFKDFSGWVSSGSGSCVSVRGRPEVLFDTQARTCWSWCTQLMYWYMNNNWFVYKIPHTW
jgi:hypothetical protein